MNGHIATVYTRCKNLSSAEGPGQTEYVQYFSHVKHLTSMQTVNVEYKTHKHTHTYTNTQTHTSCTSHFTYTHTPDTMSTPSAKSEAQLQLCQ